MYSFVFRQKQTSFIRDNFLFCSNLYDIIIKYVFGNKFNIKGMFN